METFMTNTVLSVLWTVFILLMVLGIIASSRAKSSLDSETYAAFTGGGGVLGGFVLIFASAMAPCKQSSETVIAQVVKWPTGGHLSVGEKNYEIKEIPIYNALTNGPNSVTIIREYNFFGGVSEEKIVAR